jgi:RNA polymerase sigma factor (sigma-70 family)
MKTTIDEGEDWFHRFQRGDDDAMRTTFEKYYRPVTYFALKILRDDSYAEDIVLEVFRKAWENRKKLATPRHLVNFLYLVTRNDCVSYLRSDRVAQSTEDEWGRLAVVEAGHESSLDFERVQTRLIEVVFAQIEQLPGGEILRMSFIEGKSTKQIATELDMTENNVYVIKSRSLKVLRTMLSRHEWMYLILFGCCLQQLFYARRILEHLL